MGRTDRRTDQLFAFSAWVPALFSLGPQELFALGLGNPALCSLEPQELNLSSKPLPGLIN